MFISCAKQVGLAQILIIINITLIRILQIMKKFVLFFIVLFTVSSLAPVFAIQSMINNYSKNSSVSHDFYIAQSNDIIEALKKANASRVSRYFNEVISMKLPQGAEMASVSKNQATINFKMFFEDNKISGFTLTSERELGSTRYIAGKLRGSKDFNITIMLKGDSPRQNIVTVRIN